MKTVAVLLAVFILGLITTPCSDAEASSGAVQTEFSVLDVHHATDCEVDLCSPFCSCHCCHTHLIPDNQMVDETVIYPREPVTTTYEKAFSGPLFSIFQPPRV